MGTESYTIGLARLYFAEGEALASPSAGTMDDPISLGNIVTAEITPAPTYQEHYVSVKGCRRKDKDVVIDYKVTIPFVFDEITTANVKRVMLGGNIDSTASRMPIFKKNKLEGRAILQFLTDVGTEFLYVIPKCCLKATGGIPLQAENWVEGNFNLEVLYHPKYRVYDNASASLAPYGYMDFKEFDTIGSPF